MTSQSPKTTRDVALHWWASNPDASAADVADHLNGEGRSLMPTGARALKPATLRQWKARHGLPDVVGGQGMAAPTPAPPPQPPMRPPVPAGDPPPLPRQQPPPAEASAAVWVLLGSIHPWQDNPRDNDAAAIRIAASIARFGYGRAFVAWRESGERMLVVGHTARKATLMLLDAPPVFEFQCAAGLCKVCGNGIGTPHDDGCESAKIPGVPSRGMVPVRWRDDWTEAEARAYAIADNKLGELSDWDSAELALQLRDLDADHDIAAELLGVDDDELAELMAMLEGEGGGEGGGEGEGEGEGEGDGDGDGDQAPALSERGKVYSLGPHRLMCGDCRNAEDVAKVMDGARINVAFTSPPYASQRTYDESSGFTPIRPGDYVGWFDAVQANVSEHIADDGSWFVNIKEHSEDGQRSLYVKDLTLAHVRGWGWMLVDEYCWLRQSLPGDPRMMRKFKNAWEPVFHFAAGDFKFRPDDVRHESKHAFSYADQKAAGRKISAASQGRGGNAQSPVGQGVGLAYPSNVIDIKKGANIVGHSAAYPVEFPSFFIRAFSDPGDVVFDPFLGSGTTLVASAQHGRVCVGIEISPAYCDLIRRRWHSWCVENGTNPGPDALAPAES